MVVYFVGDHELNGIVTVREWESVIQVVNEVLGLRESHWLSKYVHDVFLDIAQIEKAVTVGERAKAFVIP